MSIVRYETLVMGKENYDDYIGTGETTGAAASRKGADALKQPSAEVLDGATVRLGIKSYGSVGAVDVPSRGKGLPLQEVNQGMKVETGATFEVRGVTYDAYAAYFA